MAETARTVLRMCGVLPERFAIEWASAAEGPRFVEIVTSFIKKIKELGPLGTADGEPGPDELRRRLEAAVKAASNLKVRTAFGTLARSIKKSGDYSEEAVREGVMAKLAPQFEKHLAL